MIAFLGWLLLVLFGGIGLAALPIDLINSYRTRPQRMDLATYAERKREMGEEANRLIEYGKKYEQDVRSGKGQQKLRKNYNKFRQAVYLLEEEYYKLKLAYEQNGGSILWWWFQLFLGILSFFLSVFWVLHIIIFVLVDPPASPFLNEMFVKLDEAFSLFGTVAYGLFSFYLLWAVIKGNFKFGLRVFLFCTIHPMKIAGTLMNSFLFNVWLIMVSSVTVVQFSSVCFSIYNRLTELDFIFNVAIKNLMVIKYFWEAYYYILIILAFLSGLYLLIFPTERKTKLDD
jgi:LMBR1 domain-containing protein 1